MSDNNLVIDSWIDEYAKYIARETAKLARSGATIKGKSIKKKLSAKILEHYVRDIVLDALSEFESEKISSAEKYAKTYKNFAYMKYLIQNEIASGFEKAMCEFARRDDIEYMCQILPVKDPVNKLPY